MTREPRTYITLSECESMVNMMEVYLIPALREDEEADSLEWLANLMRVYDRMKKLTDREATDGKGSLPWTSL